ncbi:DUF2887 domain-containing protein [Nostoc sp. HG1]|uniref:DUF2887 domain-containing protein n=1 Tax=Nostoc commune TaxID=1178 RepID=UPI0018C7D20E|nr:DUF2887 domain-containing protein [Nostoc commune]MBC6433415.1 DUF2887 domain-containing protein [Nostoc sp. HG1]MBG1257751.1 DUF2887 domain-containing protein [Nostoc commune BAE]
MGTSVSPVLIQFIETILIYKLPHLSREEIRKMFGLIDILPGVNARGLFTLH